MDILVIPDSHAKPGVSNERYEILGDFIVDRKPDVIVNIGDFADMPSLSSYDKGKRSFEGRRYRDDCDSVIDAQERLFSSLGKFNKGRKKEYRPRKVLTLGNHEYRIERATQDASEFHGFISTEDLQYQEFGWEVYPFKEVVNIEGINFAHYFASGVMDRAISGVNIGRSLINKTLTTSIQGHSHLLSIATDVSADNRRMWGISAGCFFDHLEDFVSERIQLTYWRGVIYLSECQDGDFSLETISLKSLKREYS